MRDTAPRLLQLLALLQVRRQWTGRELAERLEVDVRTVRRDVGRLRRLGYPVQSFSGLGGAYLLGAGAELPPLVLADDEAVAVAASLLSTTLGDSTGIEEPALRAYVKLDSVLPARLQRRLRALRAATVGLTRPDAVHTDAATLTALATSVRDRHVVTFRHRDREGALNRRTVEPHRLVCGGRVWYLLAWDRERGDWRTFRVDRVTGVRDDGERFTERRPPADAATFVSRSVSSGAYRYRARVLMRAPAAEVEQKTSPLAGQVEPLDASSCILHTGSNSLEQLALYVALKGFEFEVLEPQELAEQLAIIGARCARAARRRGEKRRVPPLPKVTKPS